MSLTKAQCTNCGGALEVDSNQEAAVCPFCNTPYIVEKAINLYQNQFNITVDGIKSETILKNAYILLRDGDNKSAVKLLEDYKRYSPDDWRLWFAFAVTGGKMYFDNLKKAANYNPSNEGIQQMIVLQTEIEKNRAEKRQVEGTVGEIYQNWLKNDRLSDRQKEAAVKTKIGKGVVALIISIVMLVAIKALDLYSLKSIYSYLFLLPLLALLSIVKDVLAINRHKKLLNQRDADQESIKDQVNSMNNDILLKEKECMNIGQKIVTNILNDL